MRANKDRRKPGMVMRLLSALGATLIQILMEGARRPLVRKVECEEMSFFACSRSLLL